MAAMDTARLGLARRLVVALVAGRARGRRRCRASRPGARSRRFRRGTGTALLETPTGCAQVEQRLAGAARQGRRARAGAGAPPGVARAMAESSPRPPARRGRWSTARAGSSRASDARRGGRHRHELDAAARRRRRGRPDRGRRPPLDVTRLGEGVDAAAAPPAGADRAHPRGARRYRREIDALGAARDARRRDERGARRRQRRGSSSTASSGELRLRDAAPERRRGGRADAARRRRGRRRERSSLDVGGGSTELILAGFRTSLDVGSVRLTERFLHGDPPTPRRARRPPPRHVRGAAPRARR